MPSEIQTLDRAFHCLSNPTRRRVVEQLSIRSASMSELAAPVEMALPSFLQHLTVLEEAGMVRSTKVGRVRTYEIDPGPIVVAETWLDQRRRQWETRLDQLDEVLQRLHVNRHE